MVRNAVIEIGSHYYCSDWAIAACRYDALLGMPWHEHTRPRVDYSSKEVFVQDSALPVYLY